jgi:renalase
MSSPVPVTVVGAGVAGLTAARHLTAAGRQVVVLDEGAVPGGRLATRRLAGATFDHGAQFFTVRSPELAASVADWSERGVVREWCRGFGPEPDGHPRYVADGGMAALAADLALGLVVHTGIAVRSVTPAPTGWVLEWDGGRLGSGPVILTAPVPRSLALLERTGPDVPGALRHVDYSPTVALLAVLDRPPAVPPPGGVQLDEGPFSFVADNAAKGISERSALTLHATDEVSRALVEADDDAVRDELLPAARRWLGSAEVVAAGVERWPLATPRDPWPERSWFAAADPAPLVLGGDAFAGPRVEGAFLSGLHAADAVLASG